MPASTVPATPARVGAAGGTPSTSTTGNVTGPDYSLLLFMQFQFVRHARINDLHQALNNNHGDAVADTADIDQLFSNNRADIKSDADLLHATRPSYYGTLLKTHVACQISWTYMLCASHHELVTLHSYEDY